MARSGRFTLYHPGDDVTVELVADGSGTVADEGLAVELVGEGGDAPQAQLNGTAGNGVGVLTRHPDEYDDSMSYSANETIGKATISVTNPIEWMVPSDGYAASVADPVVYDAGGTVRQVDFDGTAPDDTGDQVVGQVFTTAAKDFGHAGHIAVYRYR